MSNTQGHSYEYQVGGSLRTDAPSYIERQADSELYQALLRGELCYVFSSRQMGKSSLRLRTKRRLEQIGMSCASIDMTRIGSKNITPEQWYVGIAIDLLRGFNLLESVDLMPWWNTRQHLSLIQRFSEFLEAIVLPQTRGDLFIFVDEIDSVLSLDFAVDDFFVLIRYCYNQRTENPIYSRLNWVLLGVATASDLIRDRSRTPLNIGRSITLSGFSLTEAQPLAAGLEGKVGNPQAALKEILTWTGGQPFLTQKLCRIVAEDRASIGAELRQLRQDADPEGGDCSLDYKLPIVNQHLIDLYYQLPVLAIEKFVRSCIIDHWEAQDEPEHLKTIRDRLLRHPRSIGLLELYLKVLQGKVRCDESSDQLDLLLSGLVVRHQGQLQVFSRIYREVFSPAWVENQLAVCPYQTAMNAWIASDKRDEFLLRGRALEEAQHWAATHHLNDLDYQFVIASQVIERRHQDTVAEPSTQALQQELHERDRLLQNLQQTEATLSRQNAILKAQQEAAIDGILLIDEHRRIVSYNQRFRELWQIPSDLLHSNRDQAVLSFVVAQLADPDEFLERVEFLYQHPAETSRDEIQFQDGRVFDRYSSPVRSESGTYYGRIWFFRDISEAKREEVIRQQAKQKLDVAPCVKGDFIANMSHELRTPLNAIQGFSQRLMRDSSLSASQQETVAIIHDSAKHLSSLVNQMLDLARREEQGTLQGTSGDLQEQLTVEMLTLMPPEWVSQLHQAALCTDEQQIFTLLEQIPRSHRSIALALTDIVNNFRCDRILNITQSLQGG
ncbi:MAG: AAA-like domain-containing protein [Oscillatoriophycideae cyanobacterium NC_groundwater_1537_Pr4_S-0.65um_50_18]|nr:AAA-like domain-containing protein [Oscillatoriophycideae cyanobacterium NC_groundwater_1537_Pr4_S-0.65um_50_18]